MVIHGFVLQAKDHGKNRLFSQVTTHGASCFMRGHLTLGEVGFGESMGQCRLGPCFIERLFTCGRDAPGYEAEYRWRFGLLL